MTPGMRSKSSLKPSREMNVEIAVPIVLVLAIILGVAVCLKFRRENRDLRGQLAVLELKISSSVEERLVNHTKYCETVDTLVQQQLAKEEQKWAELIAAATCRIKGSLTRVQNETKKDQDAVAVKLTQELEKLMMNFKSLLEQSYLDEYEKMRKNPPRPKKGPRKKIDPPQRYRSLDDDFNCMPPPETQE